MKIKNFTAILKEMDERRDRLAEIFKHSCSVFVFILLGGRALTLHKRGIRAIVFGETDKSDFFFIPIFLIFVYTVLACAFDLPMPAPLVKPFWTSMAGEWVGFTLCMIALVGFFATLKSFGDSFRVGIDEKHPDKLVTSGMFALSRNPIYVSFLLFFSGMFLLYPNIPLICALVFFALAVHRQILREEAFLKVHYGKAYEDYCRRVRRYL